MTGITLPSSFEESRSRFRSRLAALTGRWPGARLIALSPLSSPDLSTDVLAAEPLSERQRLVVITTGEHGIEGYLGSAGLELFFEEIVPRLDPRTTGLLLVHAINPWGMANFQRTNAANVDLNRNFIEGEFSALREFNPDYPALSTYLNPFTPLKNLYAARAGFVSVTVKNLAAFGPRRVREAALMGQYRDPRGIYFGGQEIQPETAAMIDLYRQSFRGYRQIVHLDLHTGYGPRDRMTLVTSPREKSPAAEISARFDAPRVAAANPDDFYTIQGDMIDWEYDLAARELPGTDFFAATCEFGTYGDAALQALRSLRVTILRNQVNQFGANLEAAAWVEREYRELYLPSDPAWLRKALDDMHRTFEAAVSSAAVKI